MQLLLLAATGCLMPTGLLTVVQLPNRSSASIMGLSWVVVVVLGSLCLVALGKYKYF